MKARLLILVVLAGGLAVFWATRAAAPAADKPEANYLASPEGGSIEETKVLQTLLRDRPLAGEEPPEPAELAIRVETDPTGEKNRLYYYITEAHGYYVETFRVNFYYRPTPDAELPDRPTFQEFINDYLESNGTLSGCFEVVLPELLRSGAGGSMGTSENWVAQIIEYGRARAGNPEPLPLLNRMKKCR